MNNHSNHIPYWQLQDAKARLSELVKSVAKHGPQGISVRGKLEVVVLSAQDYAKLTEPPKSLYSFFRDSPLLGAGLNLDREQTLDREIDL